jgi:Fe-S-cluster-containing hydrogenase component 2
MDALQLVEDVAHVNEERCIGCGVCESFCEFEAVSLVRREQTASPPPTINELMAGIATGRELGG